MINYYTQKFKLYYDNQLVICFSPVFLADSASSALYQETTYQIKSQENLIQIFKHFNDSSTENILHFNKKGKLYLTFNGIKVKPEKQKILEKFILVQEKAIKKSPTMQDLLNCNQIELAIKFLKQRSKG